jgi:valyl-tRNA synthetase
MGCSLDWAAEVHHGRPSTRAPCVEAFVRLYEEGLIYRDRRLINWCPRCRTALSDLEVEHDEGAQGELYEFAYPGGRRLGRGRGGHHPPETMLGDTAVAVHPDDERYRHLIGKLVHPCHRPRDPDRRRPVLVDPEFGTGAVKVTPAHDPNDFDCGKRHGLPCHPSSTSAEGHEPPRAGRSPASTASRRASR